MLQNNKKQISVLVSLVTEMDRDRDRDSERIEVYRVGLAGHLS